MRVVLSAILSACGAQAGKPSVASAAPAACGDGDLDAICDDPRVAVTAGPNPQDGPILDANTTYAVAGFAPNKRSYVVFEAQLTGEYSLYLAGEHGLHEQRRVVRSTRRRALRDRARADSTEPTRTLARQSAGGRRSPSA
jgi:hypothetical protein